MKLLILQISSFLYLIPLLIGVTKYSSLDKREKSFFLFILFSALVAAGLVITRGLGNNLYFFYLFALGEALILPFFLVEKGKWKDLKKWFGIYLVVLLAILAGEIFLRDGGLKNFNNLSLSANALILGAFAVRTLLVLRYDTMVDNLAKSSIFWFALGLCFYYFGNFLIYGVSKFYQDTDLQVLTNLYDFRLFTIYFSVIAYTIGFLKIKSGPRKVAFS